MNILPEFRSDDVGKLLLRIAVGGILLFHGIAKVQSGNAFVLGVMQQHGLPSFLAYGSYVAEIVAPLMILAGVQVRLAGLVVAADLLMAILLALRGAIFSVRMGGAWGIEVEAFFVLGGLALFFMGGGKYAVMRGE